MRENGREQGEGGEPLDCDAGLTPSAGEREGRKVGLEAS